MFVSQELQSLKTRSVNSIFRRVGKVQTAAILVLIHLQLATMQPQARSLLVSGNYIFSLYIENHDRMSHCQPCDPFSQTVGGVSNKPATELYFCIHFLAEILS